MVAQFSDSKLSPPAGGFSCAIASSFNSISVSKLREGSTVRCEKSPPLYRAKFSFTEAFSSDSARSLSSRTFMSRPPERRIGSREQGGTSAAVARSCKIHERQYRLLHYDIAA